MKLTCQESVLAFYNLHLHIQERSLTCWAEQWLHPYTDMNQNSILFLGHYRPNRFWTFSDRLKDGIFWEADRFQWQITLQCYKLHFHWTTITPLCTAVHFKVFVAQFEKNFNIISIKAVSYTHLDVYKRQVLHMTFMIEIYWENNNSMLMTCVHLSKQINNS